MCSSTDCVTLCSSNEVVAVSVAVAATEALSDVSDTAVVVAVLLGAVAAVVVAVVVVAAASDEDKPNEGDVAVVVVGAASVGSGFAVPRTRLSAETPVFGGLSAL